MGKMVITGDCFFKNQIIFWKLYLSIHLEGVVLFYDSYMVTILICDQTFILMHLHM